MWNVIVDVTVIIGSHEDSVCSVAFSPSDGKHVTSGSKDNTIRIWDVECREFPVSTLTGHMDCVQTVAYSPDGKRLVSGSSDGTVRIWNSETGDLLLTLYDHSGSVLSVAYSFDGSRSCPRPTIR